MRKTKLLSILLCCTALAACGGGGNLDQNLAALDQDPTDPPPVTTPTDEFDTGEYRANWGLDFVNPIPAYQNGTTGNGILVSVVGSGVDASHADLVDNLHPLSDDGDITGFGTFAAGIIAASRNGIGMHGLAYESQVLALNGGTTDDEMAAAVNKAVNNDVRVITIYEDRPTPNAVLATALEQAANAGIVVVISAGNTPAGTIDINPSGLALFALDSRAQSQFLIVGAADKEFNALGPLTTTHNQTWTKRAGNAGAEFYILAPGHEIYSTFIGPASGESYYGFSTGSGAATPFVAAAAAMLFQQFPHLTADEVVNILLTTTVDIVTDTTHPGVDEVNGHGLLNIGAALAPIGTNAVAIKTESGWMTTELDEAGLVSGGVFGDGVGHGFAGGAIFLDDYDRAYTTSFSSQIITANPFVDFESRFSSARDYRHAGIALAPDFYVAFAANYDVKRSSWEQDFLGEPKNDTALADNLNIRMTKGIGKQSAVSMSIGGSLSSVLSFGSPDTGFSDAANLSAGMNDPWISSSRSNNYKDGQRLGFMHTLNKSMTLSVGISTDQVTTPDYADFADLGADASRKVLVSQLQGEAGRLGWKTLAGIVKEDGMVLDSHSAGVLRLGNGADTTFYALGSNYTLTNRLSAFGRIGQSFTRVNEAGLSAFSGFDTLQTTHFAAGLSLVRAFSPADSVTLSVSQPLRLERGAARVNVASTYNYDTETPDFTNQINGLTPTGREVDVEAAYRYGLGNNAHLSANLLYQSQPGHVAKADNVFSIMFLARSTF